MLKLPNIEFVREVLPNGLEVILHQDNRIPLVHLTVHYQVGSSFEQPGCSGFAHLFEHMMFQGSRNVAKNEHGRYVDAAGGRWNASTSKDRTNYYETVSSQFLELALWLEADRMRSLQVSDENFENQRQTVIEEKKQSYDNRPYGLAFLQFDALAYDNWAYAHPIIGSVEDLLKASRQQAQEFHQTFYHPGNATLVLAGDVEPTKAMRLVKRYFGSNGTLRRATLPDLSEPPQEAEKYRRLEDPLATLPALYLGYHMPALGTPQHYALSMLSTVLSHGESSRLYQRLIYDENLITSLSSGPNQYRGPQMFSLWCQVQEGVDPQVVLERVEQELERACGELVGPAELEKARNQVLYRMTGGRATVSGIGETLARASLFFADPNRINTEFEHYAAVTVEEIRQSAAEVFRAQNRTVIEVQMTSNEH